MVPPFALGTLLRQRYLIQSILGQGGFGRTYLAIDQERFDERCVLKEFLVPYQDEALVQKSQLLFQREASTLYQIQHPQVPRFWAAFEENQRLFLVQDFVDGYTYRHWVNERRQAGRSFAEAEVRYFLTHMLSVLTYIHDRGIVHRDISPENIVLKPQAQTSEHFSEPFETGLPVLIDFGAVKEATTHWPLTSTVTRVGKVGYAPPEQLQTGQVYPNSDLYALAATCLVLLTGKEPRSLLDGQTLDWCWQAHATVSTELSAILNRMLSVYPSDRYPSAAAVWADLQPLVAPARPTPPAGAQSLIQPASLTPTLITPTTKQPVSQSAIALTRAPTTMTQPRSVAPAKHRSLQAGMAIAFVIGTGVAGSTFWKLWTEPPTQSEEVWVSGAKVPQSEATRIIGSDAANSTNSVTSPPADPLATTTDRPVSATQPQAIEFPAGKIATTLQGSLLKNTVQSYSLSATQGQILTATLNGTSVVMNLLRSNQEGVDAAAYQTRSWTGQLPADDQYVIQISGLGDYTLDIAVTPTTRPTQERTERISFARGANGTTVTGHIAPKQIRRYVLKAKRGQLVLVKVLQGTVKLSAIAPNGQRIGGTTTTSKDWKGRLPGDGDYVIETASTQAEDYVISFEVF